MSRARRSQQLGDGDPLARADIDGALHGASEQRRKRRARVLDVQEAADLPAVRAPRLAPREQIHDHRGDQPLAMLAGSVLEEYPSPGAGQAMRADRTPRASVAWRSCRRRKASPSRPRRRAGSSARGTRRRATSRIRRSSPPSRRAAPPAAGERGEQMPGRAQPAIVLLAVPVQAGRRDPGEVQQVRRLHRSSSSESTAAGSVRSACRTSTSGSASHRCDHAGPGAGRGRRRPRSPPRAAARGSSGR
jgi:hypothetical protein